MEQSVWGLGISMNYKSVFVARKNYFIDTRRYFLDRLKTHVYNTHIKCFFYL